LITNEKAMKLGERIKMIRKGQGIKQKHLAESVGISVPYLCKIEKGHPEGENVGMKILDAICKELNAQIIIIPQ